MTEQQTEDQELLYKLGFEKPITTNQAIPLSIEDLTDRIEKLQNMTNVEFSKVLKFDSDKIADFIINIDGRPTKCESDDKCKYMNVEFTLLFQYDINGFRKYSTLRNIRIINKKQTSEDFINFLSSMTIQRKNAGYFLLTSNYQHHSVYCGSAHQTSIIKRSPFSLLIPNYYHLFDRLQEDTTAMLELINRVMKHIPNQITIANHIKFFDKVIPLECTRSHDGDWCDCGDSDCEEIGSAEEYCERYCKEMNSLDYFFTHPHYFVEMENFCTGNQFSTNPKLLQLEKHPNPISYLAEIIKLSSDVFWGDSYKKNEYYLDVFANWHVFGNVQPDYIHKYYQGLMYSLKSNRPSEYHTLHNDCFCFDCLQFKRLVKEGLKFDPTKLKFSEFAEKDHSWFKEYVSEANFNEETALEIYNTITETDLNDPKYHISNKSKLNFFDSILEERYHYLGMFKNNDGGATVISLDEATVQFQPLLTLQELVEKEQDYTTGVHEIMSELRDTFTEKLSQDKIDLIYDKYTENMLN